MENIMVIAVLTPDEAMFELDKALEKTCDIADMLVQNYGIEINDEEFAHVLDIINR